MFVFLCVYVRVSVFVCLFVCVCVCVCIFLSFPCKHIRRLHAHVQFFVLLEVTVPFSKR